MEKIMIVDDDRDFRHALSSLLRKEGYGTRMAMDGMRALREIRREPVDLVLLDIRLPGMDGMKILEEMKKIDTNLMIIMMTAYSDVKSAVNAIKLGAFDYIAKPFDDDEMLLTVKRAVGVQGMSRELEKARKKLGERDEAWKVMGESPQITQILKQVEIVAPTNMTVILQGESGTGKELVARMIHQKSLRKEKPFVAIDCGAIPDTLVESELFGYEKGAFTGADARKTGYFEQANEGTLLMDEITNLPEPAQAKLLRAIEEKKIQHLGGKRDIKLDVRIIAATNIDCAAAIKRGRFREELFHRLNEFQIKLPLLRERKEDIPVLSEYFLERANMELGKTIKGFDPEAMKFLLNYNWPGNVRELKNVIKKAALLSGSKYIKKDHVTANIIELREKSEEYIKKIENNGSLKGTLDEVEKDLITTTIKMAGGNKSKAAKNLGIDRKTLYRRMKRLKI